jgi:hypothetical protein
LLNHFEIVWRSINDLDFRRDWNEPGCWIARYENIDFAGRPLDRRKRLVGLAIGDRLDGVLRFRDGGYGLSIEILCGVLFSLLALLLERRLGLRVSLNSGEIIARSGRRLGLSLGPRRCIWVNLLPASNRSHSKAQQHARKNETRQNF